MVDSGLFAILGLLCFVDWWFLVTILLSPLQDTLQFIPLSGCMEFQAPPADSSGLSQCGTPAMVDRVCPRELMSRRLESAKVHNGTSR